MNHGPADPIHADARAMIEAFAGMLTAEAPGLVERLYATGSALTSDFVVPESDVDLIFECSREPTDADLAILADLHARTESRPFVDGVYLTSAQLRAGPDSVTSAPQVTNAVLVPEHADGQLNWVTWLWLLASPVGLLKSDGSVSWRGHAMFDRADVTRRAAEYSGRTLREYWAPMAEQMIAWADAQPPDTEVPGESVAWLSLGATRLLVTMNEGRVVSKADSGRYVSMLWPEHAELVDRCLRLRRGEPQTFSLDDARASAAIVQASVALAAEPDPGADDRRH